MKRIVAVILPTLVALTSGNAQPTAERYALGQVWEYQTRAEDEGSLLKIQQIEGASSNDEIGRIYHISIIGIEISEPFRITEIGHLPVAASTLDASVTRLHTGEAAFPDAAPGIQQWREAEGGVYTIPMAEIVDILQQTVSAHHEPEG